MIFDNCNNAVYHHGIFLFILDIDSAAKHNFYMST